MIFIGIDPGATGGAFAVLDTNGDPIRAGLTPRRQRAVKSSRWKEETDALALAAIIRGLIHAHMPNRFVGIIEMPFAPSKRHDASIYLHFQSFAVARTVLEMTCQHVLEVKSKEWKKHYNLTSDKSLSMTIARRRYPSVDLRRAGDHNVAEALLIADYGRHHFQGAPLHEQIQSD